MWRWPWLIIVAVCLWLVPSPASADSSDDITVTASGWICEMPGSFTVTYISDYEVLLSWTKGEGAENTMVRAAYGRLPENRQDGYLVYYGPEESCSDTALNLDETLVPVMYQAWHQNPDGAWNEEGVWGFVEGIGMMLWAFVGLSIGIIAVALWQRRLLIYTVAFIGLLIISLHLADTSLYIGIPIGLFSGYMLYEVITWWF